MINANHVPDLIQNLFKIVFSCIKYFALGNSIIQEYFIIEIYGAETFLFLSDFIRIEFYQKHNICINIFTCIYFHIFWNFMIKDKYLMLRNDEFFLNLEYFSILLSYYKNKFV